MIKKFKDFINESYLNVDDIDDINSLNMKMFCKYLNYIFVGDKYTGNLFSLEDSDVIFGDFGSVGYFIFHKKENQTEVLYLTNYNYRQSVKNHPEDVEEMFDELDKDYKFEKIYKDENGDDSSSGYEYIRISPIDDSPVTNAFYIDVIDKFHETDFGLNHRIYHERKDTDIELKQGEGHLKYYRRKHQAEVEAEEEEARKHIYAY